jgi:hypothetical protein
MSKQTKNNKRNKQKNKTQKHYGGYQNNAISNSTNALNAANNNEGILNVIGNKLSNYTGDTTDYLKEKGLRFINSTKRGTDASSNDTNSGFISNVINVIDKGSAAVLSNINETLKDPNLKRGVIETAKETAAISEDLLENFNNNLSTPKLKEETKRAIDNAADYVELVVTSMDEPINKSIDQLSASGTKAASAAVSGAIKVGTDALGAIPFYGAIIDAGKIANDSFKSFSKMSEAASDASKTISKIVEESSQNINVGLKELKERKKEASQIANRTMNSINAFQNPLNKMNNTYQNTFQNPIQNNLNKMNNTYQNALQNPLKRANIVSGGKKTRNRMPKHGQTTKRVRFSI